MRLLANNKNNNHSNHHSTSQSNIHNNNDNKSKKNSNNIQYSRLGSQRSRPRPRSRSISKSSSSQQQQQQQQSHDTTIEYFFPSRNRTNPCSKSNNTNRRNNNLRSTYLKCRSFNTTTIQSSTSTNTRGRRRLRSSSTNQKSSSSGFTANGSEINNPTDKSTCYINGSDHDIKPIKGNKNEKDLPLNLDDRARVVNSNHETYIVNDKEEIITIMIPSSTRSRFRSRSIPKSSSSQHQQ